MLSDGEDIVVIDVREQHEYNAGCFEGALHLSKGVIERDIEKHPITEDARIVLYCGGGFRSAIAAESLTRMGYSNVYSLWGGWRSLVATGLAAPNQETMVEPIVSTKRTDISEDNPRPWIR